MKYMIKPLESFCVDFLADSLSAANVFSFLQFCSNYEVDKKLREKCMEFLRTNTDAVLCDELFPAISHKFLVLLLEDDLLIVEEIHLFKAVCFSVLQIFSIFKRKFYNFVWIT